MSASAHPDFSAPASAETRIWRYLTFAKYIDLVEREEIFFARADRLGDPFEGTLSKANVALWGKASGDPEIARKARDSQKIVRAWIRQWNYVSCWHMSEYESAAMWQLHAPAGQAIALQSTFARLKAVLPPEASLGVVKYVDYDTVAIPEANLFWAFLHKRQSFEHEAELRAIILDPLFHDDTPPRVNLENPGQGRRVAVNLKELVQRVVVSPTCPDDWYYELVARVTERLGSHFPVDRSSLDDQPIF